MKSVFGVVNNYNLPMMILITATLRSVKATERAPLCFIETFMAANKTLIKIAARENICRRLKDQGRKK